MVTGTALGRTAPVAAAFAAAFAPFARMRAAVAAAMAARDQVGGHVERAARHFALDELLDVEQEALFVGGKQRNGFARCARAAGTADAVHVVFGVVRQVVVDDAGHAGHIQATRRHVGGDQHFEFAGLEGLKGLHAVGLGLVAVDRFGLDAITFQVARQACGADLGVREDDDLIEAARLHQMHDGSALGVAGHLVGDLRDGRGGGVARRHFDFDGVVQVRPAQLADFVAERGREQKALTLRGQQADDALQVRQKAHVEHAVRFVQHQDADLAEVHVLLFNVIEQTARRGNQHFAAAAQRFLLRTDIHAAEHHGRAQRRLLAVALDALEDLVREFARGRQDQRAHRMPGGRSAGVGQRHEAMQDRDRERRRLAGAGLGGAHDVAARHHHGNRLRLDGRRGGIAGFGDGLQQQGVQPEIVERRRGRVSGGCYGLSGFSHQG